MARSLRAQVLWAPTLGLAAAVALVLALAPPTDQVETQWDAIVEAREQVDQAMLQLKKRHSRTIARVRGALVNPQPEARAAILAWTSAHYRREMVRHVQDAAQPLRALNVHGGRGLIAQFDEILTQAHQIAPIIEQLATGAITLDEESSRTLLKSLDTRDHAISQALRVAEARLRRASTWKQPSTRSEPSSLVRAVLIMFTLWAPLSLFLAWRPLARLSQLASGRQISATEGLLASSREEEQLASRTTSLQRAQQELQTRLSERARGLEKATQAARRAERELALFKLYNENLVNNLRSAIVVSDGAGNITSFNRAARAVLALEDADLGRSMADHPLASVLAGRNDDPGADPLARAMDGGTPVRFDSVPFAHQEREILLELAVAPYRDESGAARGLLWVADDVTEAVNTKSQLLAAERLAAVGRVSAQVAHEIRNPLSAIGLNAELLEEELGSSTDPNHHGEARQLLRGIGAEIERLTEITEGYLQLARLPRPTPRAVDINQIVRELLAMLREELRSSSIEVVLDLPTPAPMAHVDAGQLRQALLNIVRNSREAMEDGGTLQLSTGMTREVVVLEVTDTGNGVPEHLARRVFEPFFSTKPNGTGLGLSLTQQIIMENNGTIRVQPCTDKGTKVVIELPADGQTDHPPSRDWAARS